MHIQYFEGGNALSAFRAHGLVAHLRLISDRVCGVSCQAVHWLWTDEALSADARNRFAALLSYGEPAIAMSKGLLVVVAPRLGTVSPWASKATDIARNCGLVLRRVERVLEYRISMKPSPITGAEEFSEREREAFSAVLHDRMTESVL